MSKWKYSDPKLKSESEAWYENVPEDEELENWIRALIQRHSFNIRNGSLAVTKDAALVPLLMKLVYKWKEK